MALRAAVYVRVSTIEQGKGWSLDAQTRECRAYCDKQGYTVRRIYRDLESGRTLERDGLQRLLGICERGDVDVVVVWRQDRFARDSVASGLLERHLRSLDVRLESIILGPQDDTPEVRFMSRVQAAVDEYEADRIIARMQLGRMEAARSGIWPMKPPFGYTRDPATRRLVPEPEQAALVQGVIQGVAAGMRVREAAEVFGIHHTTAGAWCRAERYLGTLLYAGVRVEDAWDPLIDEATWNAAQTMLDARHPDRAIRPGRSIPDRSGDTASVPRAGASSRSPPR